MSLIEKYLNEIKKAYQIKNKGTKKLVGNVALKTAKEIHGDDIEEIDHKNGIVWLKSKSKYGR